MIKNYDYYLNLTNRIEEFILQNNNFSLHSYWDAKNLCNNYFIKEEKFSSSHRGNDALKVIQNFSNDLKNYLMLDHSFKITDNILPRSFILELSIYLYDSHSHDPSLPPKAIIPSIEEFAKVIKVFESVIPTLDLFIHNAPQSIAGKNITSYFKEVLSLNNTSCISKLHQEDFYEIINDEMEMLTNRFSNEKDHELKEGIKNYLTHKEPILEKYHNKDFEENLFEQIKVILHSDYWSEMVDYLPTMRVKKHTSAEFKDMFKMNTNPVHYFDLDKDYILGISNSIITDRDFSSMVSTISDAINTNKPNNIDFINPSQINGQFKVFISGIDINEDMVNKVGKIFESMIHEYNSENVIKTGSYKGNRDNTIRKNQDYLNKASEVYWLNIELGNENEQKNNKKNKL